jgi:hypothetical protein
MLKLNFSPQHVLAMLKLTFVTSTFNYAKILTMHDKFQQC